MRVTRKQQIIALPGGDREDVGIVGEQNVQGAGHYHSFGAPQIQCFLARRLEIHAGQVQHGFTETKLKGLPSQEVDAAARSQ